MEKKTNKEIEKWIQDNVESHGWETQNMLEQYAAFKHQKLVEYIEQLESENDMLKDPSCIFEEEDEDSFQESM